MDPVWTPPPTMRINYYRTISVVIVITKALLSIYLLRISLFVCLSIYVCLWLCSPLLDLGRFFSFIFYTVGRTPCAGGSARRKAATCTQNKRTQTSLPQAGFEPTIPLLERAKTIHALDRVAHVIGRRPANVSYSASD
jgi:hypothetical protein